MCGIVGYIGGADATPVIMEGLRRLEYRGYDSAGICLMQGNGTSEVFRSEGKLVNLERLMAERSLTGSPGIGHTRWATHGRPSETNAHPHRAGNVILVHNGIIENHSRLKSELKSLGHTFRSDTDTEVVAHLIEQRFKECGSFEQAVRRALAELHGAFALCILCEDEPDMLIAAKQGSPLVVGVGEGEFFVASDVPAILSRTREVIFLADRELAVFHSGTVSFSTLDGDPLEKVSRYMEWSPILAEKGGYRHFMLKEIFEQPQAVRNTLAGTLTDNESAVWLGDLNLDDASLRQVRRICLVACGTSWHAALIGKYLLEEHCHIPVEVDIASEFRYRRPVIDQRTLVMAISQSGETADTLAALREADYRGVRTLAICNVVDSSIAREAEGLIYTHAGPEIGVASTKAFITQITALYLFTLRFGRAIGTLGRERSAEMIASLVKLPALIEATLALDTEVEAIARRFCHARSFLYLGRGMCFPIALEGALKLKEISYIHAEGYPAGEMKHGPIALIDEEMPVVALAQPGETYEKILSNIEEVRARGGRVIAVCNVENFDLQDRAEAMIRIPAGAGELTPLLMSIPLQLLAYHIAVLRGTDVDQPRNLAKSVTVE
jgi:glucosamine--fructose-6-phosphate aminotransferase (isomerizing)